MSIPVEQRSIEIQNTIRVAKASWIEAMERAVQYVAFEGDYPEDFHSSEKLIDYKDWRFGGVYVLYQGEDILDIGSSKNVGSRIHNHQYSERHTAYWDKVRAIRIENDQDRLALERYLKNAFNVPHGNKGKKRRKITGVQQA